MFDILGIFVLKFEDDIVVIKFCVIGSIKEELFDKEFVVKKIIEMIKKKYC